MFLLNVGIDRCMKSKENTIKEVGQRLWDQWFEPIGSMTGGKAAAIKQKLARIGSIEEDRSYNAFWKLRCVMAGAFGAMLQQVNFKSISFLIQNSLKYFFISNHIFCSCIPFLMQNSLSY